MTQPTQLILNKGERTPWLVLLVQGAPPCLDAFPQRDDVVGAVVVPVADLAKQLRREDVIGRLAYGAASRDLTRCYLANLFPGRSNSWQ